MISSRVVNEGHSFTKRWKLFDPDYAASSPTTARYRIDCLTSKTTVRDWVELTPTSVIDIPVTPDDNKIVNSGNVNERKQMVLQTNYGTSTQAVFTEEWTVKNLQGVS